MADPKEIRAFLAIDPPASIREEMARIQERLKKSVQGMIRWAGPASIHLTLKFFGDTGQEDVALISEVIEKEVTTIEPLYLEIKTLGVFPDIRRPRVIWLGTVGDVARLAILQEKLDRGFEDLGFEKENRPFRAHWTLARIKSSEGLTGMARTIESGAGLLAGDFIARSLILFRSELRPQGAVYSKLAEYAFKG